MILVTVEACEVTALQEQHECFHMEVFPLCLLSPILGHIVHFDYSIVYC